MEIHAAAFHHTVDLRPDGMANQGKTPYSQPEVVDTFHSHALVSDKISAVSRNVRNITPREMVVLSYRLYESGIITGKEYAALSCQPELHPDFNKKTGGLTNALTKPDSPRDFIAYWENRLAILRQEGDNQAETEKTKRIVNILLNLDAMNKWPEKQPGRQNVPDNEKNLP